MREQAIYQSPGRLWRDRHGASLMEFTIVFPFLIILALGTFEFGRALHHHHIVSKAVRDAGRYLARVPATCPVGAPTGSIDDPNHITEAQNLALKGETTGGTNVLNYWTSLPSVAVVVECFDNTGGVLRGQPGIPTIQVTATLDYQDLGFLTILGLQAFTFVVDHEQLHIGE